MFVKVKFHGLIGKICSDTYEVEVNTVREAIRAVTMQLKDKLIRKDGSLFTFTVKECPFIERLDCNIQTEELNLYPLSRFSGGGGGGFLSFVTIAVGAALIYFSAGIGAGVAAALGSSVSAATGAAIASGAMWTAVGVGAVLCLNGISSLMSVQMPDVTSGASNDKSSRIFGTKDNTTKIGTRIPIGYGKYVVGGHFLSINTQAVDRTLSTSTNGNATNSFRENILKYIYDKTNGKWGRLL